MRKMMSLLVALLICMSLACPVLAAENTFVPSITYKDGPDVETAVQGDKEKIGEGENVSDCVVISSITDAKEKTTDISQESRDLLLEVYEKLSDGSMTLPIEEGYVIRELVDVNHKLVECVGKDDHSHDPELKKEGVVISVKFDLGVKADTDVAVLSYHGGEWAPVLSVVNNGDGTITCVMEHFCPVVFCVDADAELLPPQTGDNSGVELIGWSVLLVVALLAIVCLAVFRRKFAR